MTTMLVRGVSAAVLTPRLPDGSVDTVSLRNLLEFLLDKVSHSKTNEDFVKGMSS